VLSIHGIAHHLGCYAPQCLQQERQRLPECSKADSMFSQAFYVAIPPNPELRRPGFDLLCHVRLKGAKSITIFHHPRYKWKTKVT
jgi:hypothetical protein